MFSKKIKEFLDNGGLPNTYQQPKINEPKQEGLEDQNSGHAPVIQGSNSKHNIDPQFGINDTKELKNRLPEELETNQSQPQPRRIDKKGTIAEAKALLEEYFKNLRFDFKEFARINNIAIYENCRPHSDIVVNSFLRMKQVVNDLLDTGITFDKDTSSHHEIKLTADEVINARNSVESNGYIKPNDKAYKLYSELVNLIHEKLLHVVQDDSFIKNQRDLYYCLPTSYNLFKSFLSLPLVNFDGGMELCKRMTKTSSFGQFSVHNLSVDTMSDEQKLSPEYQDLVKEFQQLGVFFAFKNMKLGEQALPFLKTIASFGMKLPLFMAEITTPERDGVQSLSNDLVGVAINEKTVNVKFRGFPVSHRVIGHAITGHARSAVGAMNSYQSIAFQNLSDVLKGHDDVIQAIKDQILDRDSVLRNCEDYIAYFNALVLCCLNANANPFDYIKDERLWRLYYEFGGPDFVNVMIAKGFGSEDILSKKEDKWSLSGYPSKFGIDINQIKDKSVVVSGLEAVGKASYVVINKTTILPPPPLGYCYTTENGKLQLKVDKNILQSCKDDQYYDPTFCCLTAGPLTLMYAVNRSDPNNPKPLQHHFEALPNESSGILKQFSSELSKK